MTLDKFVGIHFLGIIVMPRTVKCEMSVRLCSAVED